MRGIWLIVLASRVASADPEPTAAIHVGLQHTAQYIPQSSYFDDFPAGSGLSVDIEGGVLATPSFAVVASARVDHYAAKVQDPFQAKMYDFGETELHASLRVHGYPARWLMLGAGLGGAYEREAWYTGGVRYRPGVVFELHAGVVVGRVRELDVETLVDVGDLRYVGGDKQGADAKWGRLSLGVRWR